MVLVYVCLGSLLLLFDVPLNIAPQGKTIIGVVLLFYGLMRSVLMYQKYKRDQDNSNEEHP